MALNLFSSCLVIPHGAPGGEFCTSVVPVEVTVGWPGCDGALLAILETEQREKKS